MGAKPFWFSDNLLTQCLQGLIVSEDQNMEEFHLINGVGERKMEKYGPAFMAVIIEHTTT